MSLGTTPPPANGLKSTLKVAVPLVALVGVVFGLTYITMYTPPKPDDTDNAKGPEGQRVQAGEPPLRFFSSRRAWDPPIVLGDYRHYPLSAPSAVAAEPDPETGRVFSYTLQDRIFQGFFEPSGDDPTKKRRAQFWFENRNPSPVTLQLRGVSCTACSGGRLAAIPPETTRLLLQRAAVSALPAGLFNGYAAGMVQPACGLSLHAPEAGLPSPQWTEYQFQDNPHATYKVPAANNADKWSPQWGILELTFRVNGNPGDTPKPLQAAFATVVDGTDRTGAADFGIAFAISPAAEVAPSSIDVGRIDQLSGDKHAELLIYSNTRGPGSEFGDLKEPEFLVQLPGGATDPQKFVEVGKPVRVPEAELIDWAERLAGQKRIAKMRAAYRVPVTIHPKVGETRMDIGHFERVISFTAGDAPQQLKVTGLVRGRAWLDNDRNEIDLGNYTGGPGSIHRFNLTTESKSDELAVVKAECKPTDFGYELERQPDRGGQGAYTLKITVPPGKFGNFKGEVVLEVKGTNPQRMRLPVTGKGTFGAGK